VASNRAQHHTCRSHPAMAAAGRHQQQQGEGGGGSQGQTKGQACEAGWVSARRKGRSGCPLQKARPPAAWQSAGHRARRQPRCWQAGRQAGSASWGQHMRGRASAPVGEEAAASAMVARNDLSPHSAANTRVKVLATMVRAAAPAGGDSGSCIFVAASASTPIGSTAPATHAHYRHCQPAATICTAAAAQIQHHLHTTTGSRHHDGQPAGSPLTAAKARHNLLRLLLLLRCSGVSTGGAAQRLHPKPDEQRDSQQIVQRDPKSGHHLHRRVCSQWSSLRRARDEGWEGRPTGVDV
jgi:hypothetical protein